MISYDILLKRYRELQKEYNFVKAISIRQERTIKKLQKDIQDISFLLDVKINYINYIRRQNEERQGERN